MTTTQQAAIAAALARLLAKYPDGIWEVGTEKNTATVDFVARVGSLEYMEHVSVGPRGAILHRDREISGDYKNRGYRQTIGDVELMTRDEPVGDVVELALAMLRSKRNAKAEHAVSLDAFIAKIEGETP